MILEGKKDVAELARESSHFFLVSVLHWQLSYMHLHIPYRCCQWLMANLTIVQTAVTIYLFILNIIQFCYRSIVLTFIYISYNALIRLITFMLSHLWTWNIMKNCSERARTTFPIGHLVKQYFYPNDHFSALTLSCHRIQLLIYSFKSLQQSVKKNMRWAAVFLMWCADRKSVV